jgi:hypothetical protein
MWRKCRIGALSLGVFVLTAFGALVLGVFLRYEVGFEWVYAVAQVAIPLGVTAWTISRLQRPRDLSRPKGGTHSRTKLGWLAIVCAYVLTAVVGGPAVQNSQTAWAVAEYQRLHTDADARPEKNLPRIETYAAIPVLPGFVLAYYSYTIGPLYGLEGWGLFAWYGVGVKQLGELPLSVS